MLADEDSERSTMAQPEPAEQQKIVCSFDWYVQSSAGRFVAVQAQADAVARPSFLTPIFSCRRASLHTALRTVRANSAMVAGGDELST